jgi:hypothetical protein
MRVRFTVNPASGRCDRNRQSRTMDPCVRTDPCPAGYPDVAPGPEGE